MSFGDVFYKDGDKIVSNYTPATVKVLLLSATVGRQAAFAFISKSNYDSLLSPLQRQPSYKNVEQTWDFETPCAHCGVSSFTQRPLYFA
jgi:hypothetical protein